MALLQASAVAAASAACPSTADAVAAATLDLEKVLAQEFQAFDHSLCFLDDCGRQQHAGTELVSGRWACSVLSGRLT